MAFGQTTQEKPTRTPREDGDQTQSFEWQWIPLNGSNKKDRVGGEQIYKGGARKIRLLPELDANGNVVVNEAGIPETATESRFLEVWMEVMKDGQMKPQRVILDWRRQFDNPYWNRIAQPTEKGSPQRKAQRHKFALNVVDLTPVLQDENGRYVYPNEQGQYIVGATGQLVSLVEGKPEPLRKVRILEGSAGDAGGKHFLQQIIDSVSQLEDADGNPRQPHEVDLIIKITGVDVDTRRSPRPTANFNPLPESLVHAPRYDLAAWTTPWPDDAVNALIDGAEFSEVVEQFNIKLFPELVISDDAVESVLTGAPTGTLPVVSDTPRRSTRKATKTDENLFDE